MVSVSFNFCSHSFVFQINLFVITFNSFSAIVYFVLESALETASKDLGTSSFGKTLSIFLLVNSVFMDSVVNDAVYLVFVHYDMIRVI